MKSKITIVLIFLAFFINAQDKSGLGIHGNMFLSPVQNGKNYYAAYGSFNYRDETDFFNMKMFIGMQFHELVKIIDLGWTFKLFPVKNVYLGVSPYTLRISTLKETEETETPLAVSKEYGSAHLGYSLPLDENIKMDFEVNYNYFYKSEAAGYGFSVGFIFYSDELINSLFGK
jgi:hypothetical protein